MEVEVPELQRKPGALRNGAPFKDWNLPAAMTRARERLARAYACVAWGARSYEYQLRLARLPVPRDLDSFDFKESQVNETQLRQLYAADHLISARNMFLVVGPVRASRIWPPPWFDTSSCTAKGARFYSVLDLVNQLDAEKCAGRAGIGRIACFSKLYERVSPIVTTNLSFGE